MIALFIFAVSMGMFLMTIAPTLSFFDSGEMIAGAYTLGVSHPPGYPVYVTLGKLFSFLPLNHVAFRLNLMSAFFASMTSVMVYYITRAMLDDGSGDGPLISCCGEKAGVADAAGIFAALAFSFSYNLWAWAVVSKFYTLNAFVVSCIMMLLVRWRRARKEEGDTGGGHSLSYLYVIAFICGIAGVVHISQFVLFPTYLLYIVIVDGSVFVEMKDFKGKGRQRLSLSGILRRVNYKTLIFMGFFFMLGHSIYLHVPLRASQEPLINWGGATNLAQFKWVYNREGYPTVGGARNLLLLWKQFQSFDLVREFTWAGIPLIFFGLYGHFRRDWRNFFILLFGSVFMVFAIVVGGNPIEENIFLLEQFYIPVYIFLTVAMGGAAWLMLRKSPAAALALGLSLPFIFLGEPPVKYIWNLFGGRAEVQNIFLFGRYFMPSFYFVLWAVLAAVISLGTLRLIRPANPALKYVYAAVAASIFVLYPAYQVRAHYWKNDRSNNFIAYDMGTAELTFAPQSAVLFTWGDSGAFPMWYLQDVEEKRPDVLLIHTPHLPLEWFLDSIRREPAELGDINQIKGSYKYLRNYNGIKGIEQLRSIPEDFRDPAAMIKNITEFNTDRPFAFDYSSRYSLTMPYNVFPYGITYRFFDEKKYVDENMRTWRFLVTRGLPNPSISLDLDETKAVSIYGFVKADLGRKYFDMGQKPLAKKEFFEAIRFAPELWESLSPFLD